MEESSALPLPVIPLPDQHARNHVRASTEIVHKPVGAVLEIGKRCEQFADPRLVSRKRCPSRNLPAGNNCYASVACLLEESARIEVDFGKL